MTGLILKDLFYLRRTGRALIALAAFYLVLFLTSSSEDAVSGGLSGVVTMLTVILSVNAFAYDELAKWRMYELSLPVSRNTTVLARYLLALIFSTGFTLLSLLFELISLRGLPPEALLPLWISWGAALLCCAVLFPAVYKFGTQKARLILIAVVLLPIMGAALLKNLSLPAPDEAALQLWLNLLPLLAAILFLLSFWLSCRICAKKED